MGLVLKLNVHVRYARLDCDCLRCRDNSRNKQFPSEGGVNRSCYQRQRYSIGECAQTRRPRGYAGGTLGEHQADPKKVVPDSHTQSSQAIHPMTIPTAVNSSLDGLRKNNSTSVSVVCDGIGELNPGTSPTRTPPS